MKHSKLLDAAIVAALLLAHVPGLAEELHPIASDRNAPIALIAPAVSDAPATQDDPAERL